MGNIDKFTGKTFYYNNARPAYAETLLNTLYADYGFTSQSKIADIGSGTGIFTEQLLKRGSTVYGVEPNADMRALGETKLKEYRNFISVNGDATNTTLLNSSINIVTAAQSFHWFPLDEFRKECNRILQPNGLVVIIYNQRCNDKINEELTSTIARYCEIGSSSFGSIFIESNRKRISDFFKSDFIEIRKKNSLFMNCKKFLSYWLSRSYAPNIGDVTYEPFVNDIISIFNEYAKGDKILLEQESVAYIGKCA